MNESSHIDRICFKCGQRIIDETDGLCTACSSLKTIAPGSHSPADARTIPPAKDITSESIPSEAEPGTNADSECRGLRRYQNREEIGRWSHGLVFQAYHPGLDRTVLIRQLEFGENTDSKIKDEFIERAQAISRLDHANTVSAMEAGIEGEVAFVVQEKVDGKSISGFHRRSAAEKLREGFFPGQDLARLTLAAASGVQAIHEQGITHGLLSSECLLIDSQGRLKVVGLIEPTRSTPTNAAIERAGPIRADIIQLGAVFVEITTGNEMQAGVQGLATDQIAHRIKKQNPGLRNSYCKVLARCITQQDDGYNDCNQIIADLSGLAESSTSFVPWRTRVFSMLLESLAGTVVFTLLGGVAASLLSDSVNREVAMFISLGGLIFFTVTMESTFGFTPIRRLFGMKLYDYSGGEAHWARRLLRSSSRFALVFVSMLLIAMAVPLMAKVGGATAIFLSLATMFILFPLCPLYVPAMFIKSRWTLYDYWSGATWGESSTLKQESAAKTTSELEGKPILGDAVDRVDQFEIHQSLGEGGMGCVFLARDQTLHRNVAIKVLAGHLISDSETRTRFQREAQLAARISHPNVARIYGDGVWNGSPYIAMELVKGKDLHDTVSTHGPMNVDSAWRCVIQTAEALQAAAALGVIHRDIKPANLMLTPDKTIKVMDFGISREIHSDAEVTQAGGVIGTPTYMSPEQSMGLEVDFRSDIYSLGLTLYYLLSGRTPFDVNNPMLILAMKLDSTPAPLLGEIVELTPNQQTVIDKMIAKDPDDRFPDYESLLIQLRRNFGGDRALGQATKRIGAEICNLLSFYLLGLLLAALTYAFSGSTNNPSWGAIITNSALLLVESLFIGMYVWGIGKHGWTSGKKMLGLQVTRTNGHPVGFLRALLRFSVAYPAFFTLPVWPIRELLGIAHPETNYLAQSILIVNVVMIVASIVLVNSHPKRQAIHDLAADTVVLQMKS